MGQNSTVVGAEKAIDRVFNDTRVGLTETRTRLLHLAGYAKELADTIAEVRKPSVNRKEVPRAD